MELNYLRDFVVLARTCQFQEAAEQLFISQSSLSKHIKAIEQEFGENLFNRSTRRVELTSFGKEFLPYAQKIVAIQSDYMNTLIPDYSHSKDIISIGISPQVSFYCISNMISNFSRSNSQYSVKLFENEDSDLFEMLKRGKCNAIISAAISKANIDYNDIDYIPMFEDTLVAILPAGHPLAGNKSISIEELADNNYIQLGHDYKSDPALEPPAIYVSRSSMAIDLVKKGLGISIITKTASVNHPDDGVVYVNMNPSPKLKICLMFLKGRSMGPGIHALLNYFQEHLPGM